jgi:hypothetical protein
MMQVGAALCAALYIALPWFALFPMKMQFSNLGVPIFTKTPPPYP